MTFFQQELAKTSFCALDLETTGINPALHMIIEVGAVRFTMNSEGEILHRMVNPGMKIPEEVIGIHGITDDMVSGAPQIGDVLDDLSQMIDGSILVIHNPDFDLAFLKWAYQRGNRSAPPMVAVDTVRLSRRAWPGLCNHRLETLCEHLKLDYRHHRALDDARACMDVFRSVARLEDPDRCWTLGDLAGYHGSFVRSKRIRGKRISTPGQRSMGLQLGKTATITYRDQDGALTIRSIQPREFITVGNNAFVLAHCDLRGDIRYFRMDRIKAIN